MSDDIDLEREKTMSFELGHIDQLDRIADDLRQRAGETFANAESHIETERAKFLKSLAEEYEELREEKNQRWNEKYKGESDE